MNPKAESDLWLKFTNISSVTSQPFFFFNLKKQTLKHYFKLNEVYTLSFPGSYMRCYLTRSDEFLQKSLFPFHIIIVPLSGTEEQFENAKQNQHE